MAITTLDGAAAGAVAPNFFFKVGTASIATGIWYTPFYAAGSPPAAAVPSPGLNGTALTSYAGQLPFSNPGAGNSYLMRFGANTSLAGTLLLCDRLWHNSGIAVATTTAQAITSPTWPARDITGSTSGYGLVCGLEITSTTGNAAVSNTTLTYTSANGGSRTGTIASVTAAAKTGNVYPFSLQAGDTNIASIQDITLGTTYASGSLSLVLFRVLAEIGLNQPYADNAVDFLTGGAVQLFNNTVPYLIFIPSNTTATNFSGVFQYTQG